MVQVQKITPCLWFKDNNAQEAMEYYVSVFPDSRIVSIKEYPGASVDEQFAKMAGKVLTGVFELSGQQFMCLDGSEPAEHLFAFNNAVSFMVSCKDQAEIDAYWDKLSDRPDEEQCGWCTDRFGVRWQIVPEHMEKLLDSDSAMKCMMGQKKIVIAELEAAK